MMCLLFHLVSLVGYALSLAISRHPYTNFDHGIGMRYDKNSQITELSSTFHCDFHSLYKRMLFIPFGQLPCRPDAGESEVNV